MSEHQCQNFRMFEVECPFMRLEGHEEDNNEFDDEVFRFIKRKLSEKFKKDEEKLREATKFEDISEEEKQKELEMIFKDQKNGGTKFIPDVKKNPSSFLEQNRPGFIATLIAILLSRGIRKTAPGSSMNLRNLVGIAERQLGAQLSTQKGVRSPAGSSPGQGGRTGGRGGFIVNAADRLRKDFNLGRKKKVRFGMEQQSGFFFPGEPR